MSDPSFRGVKPTSCYQLNDGNDVELATAQLKSSNAEVCYIRTTSTPALGPARAAEQLRWCIIHCDKCTNGSWAREGLSMSCEAVPNLISTFGLDRDLHQRSKLGLSQPDFPIPKSSRRDD